MIVTMKTEEKEEDQITEMHRENLTEDVVAAEEVEEEDHG